MITAKKFYVGNNNVSHLFINNKRHLYPVDKTVVVNHINNSTSSRLQNKNPSTDRLVYSSQDPYANGIGQFVRNTSCWINGIKNISCFSPAQLSGSAWNQRSGTLVTKKHILLCKHSKPSIISGGTPIIFVDKDNNVIRRNLIQSVDDVVGDISIGLLDNEVPSNIEIAKVLPLNYQDYIGYPENMLSVALDQEEKAIIKAWSGLLNYTTSAASYKYVNVVAPNLSYVSPSLHQYSTFTEDTITGDSGNPIFIILDNELILISVWHTPWSGPFVTDRYSQTNALINSLSPNQGYSLTPIDLDLVYRKYY